MFCHIVSVFFLSPTTHHTMVVVVVPTHLSMGDITTRVPLPLPEWAVHTMSTSMATVSVGDLMD